jgi:hypothetical protein
MYEFSLLEDSLIVCVTYNGAVVDESGPWESPESATTWATSYVNFKNSGLPEPQVY